MAATDESLMALYQGGDAAAFEELVTRHERPLWGFLRRFVGDAVMAEDLLQEVFMRVVAVAAQWKPEAKFSTWLYTIARNLCTDHARRAVHRQVLSLEGALPGGAVRDSGSGPVLGDGVASRSGGTEEAVMNRQLGAEIDRAVQALPVDQREVFLMREMMDMQFSEIARAVGAAEPTVKSRMRYALEKLRQSLHDFRDQPAVATGTGTVQGASGPVGGGAPAGPAGSGPGAGSAEMYRRTSVGEDGK